MSDRANAIIKDVLDNHLPRIVEGLQKGYPDENQILVAYDHAVRARILAEQPDPLDEAEIANKQDEAWLDAIAAQWNRLTGRVWETKDDAEANITVLFDSVTQHVHCRDIKRIATLEQALRASSKQILELINGGASLLAHTPLAPSLSDAGTAQSFLGVQIILAKQTIANNTAALNNEKEGK